ncbi:hypothetical protein JHK82_027633 [Glycine max]|nr:hypothetical protein JHK82_027633 [Glycine max]
MYEVGMLNEDPWICRNHCGLYSRLGVVVVAVFEAAAEAASKAAEAGGGCAGRGRDVIVKERTGISFVVDQDEIGVAAIEELIRIQGRERDGGAWRQQPLSPRCRCPRRRWVEEEGGEPEQGGVS